MIIIWLCFNESIVKVFIYGENVINKVWRLVNKGDNYEVINKNVVFIFLRCKIN